MLRMIVGAAIIVAFSCGRADAQCAVQPWSVPYFGSNTSTTMAVGSGQPCQVYPSVGGTNIITSIGVSAQPSNGSVSVNAGDVIQYQSRPGFTGSDSFTFNISGSGPGGNGSSSVQVSVSVQ